jgi:hypothetical protein
MALKVSPTAGNKPVLAEGEYGAGGEAELTRIVARQVPVKAGNPPSGEYFCSFNGHVDDPNMGRVFFQSEPFGKFKTTMAQNSGSVLPTFLSQLGLSADAIEFADEADENGNHALLGPNPCPMKVVVRLGLDRNGDRNVIQNIMRLA